MTQFITITEAKGAKVRVNVAFIASYEDIERETYKTMIRYQDGKAGFCIETPGVIDSLIRNETKTAIASVA